MFDFIRIKRQEICQEDIMKETQKCNELFEELLSCVKKYSWNDNYCNDNVRSEYENCVVKRDKMQAIYGDRIDKENMHKFAK